MPDLFGSPQGRSLAEQDMAREAMLPLQMEHTLMQSQAIPSQIAQRSAQADYLGARAGALRADTAVQNRVAAMAQDANLKLEDLPDLYLKAGSPKDAMKVAGQVASINQKRQSSETNQARQQLIEVRTRISNATALGQALGGVDSPEALQTVLQDHARVDPNAAHLLDGQGNLLPQVAEQWDKVRDNLKTESLTEKERLAADYRTQRLGQIERDINRKQKTADFWQNMDNQEERSRRQAAGRGVKAGTDIFDKAEGTRIGTDFVNSQFTNLEIPQAKILGRDVAERAKQLRSVNPALTPGEATRAAFDAMQKEGKFTGLKMKPPGAIQSEQRPLPLPEDGDKTKLKEGFWYSDGNTKMQWGGLGIGWKKQQTKGGTGRIGAGTYAPSSSNTDEEDLAAERQAAADEAQNAEDDALAIGE